MVWIDRYLAFVSVGHFRMDGWMGVVSIRIIRFLENSQKSRFR